MNKKELLQLNHSLYTSLEEQKALCEELQAENQRLKEIIDGYWAEKYGFAGDVLRENVTPPPTESVPAPAVPETNFFSPAKEYAASSIGKTVVEAARLCNRLSIKGDTPEHKEQINLILGRTEVAKSEILKIALSDDTLDGKKDRIDSERDSASDYFNGIMAQY